VYLERAEKLAHKTIIERFVAVARSKNASPTWSDVRAALLLFDRAGLLGLVQDLYTASKGNQAFLHARLGLGHDQLQPFKASISNWICPDVMKNQPISVSKAKKAIADYKKAIGRPDGMAELSIFYCETVPRIRIEPTSCRARQLPRASRQAQIAREARRLGGSGRTQ
jgi:hypothetical protein